jgi:PBSX family phage terminase large subunit
MNVEIKASPVFRKLWNAYKPKKKSKQGFVLEGGSGSSKTWSIIQFLIIYCQMNTGKNKDILAARQQYSDVKSTILKDFIKMLKLYGLYGEKCHVRSHPQSYELFGNMIYFGGLDSMGAHGERHDIVWINESMEADEQAFKQLNQRCNELFILDYNPSFTEHWIFKTVLNRPDVTFMKSTLLDNPFLPDGQRDEILAYEPTHPEDRDLPEAQRRPHPTNISNGTADDTMWKVYGLGLRAQHEGVIFRYVNWIKEFPADLDYSYAMDFGFTIDPTVILKCAEEGNNIYAQNLCYEPIETPQALSDYMDMIGIERHLPIVADSSDKYVSKRYGAIEMVKDLRELGWNIHKVSKTHDIVYWIQKLKESKLNLVESTNFRREQENYCWRKINGVTINQPIDKHNHNFDGLRYYKMDKKRNKKRFW